MSSSKVFVNGVWVDICDVRYHIYTNGVFEALYEREFTFYDSDGNGHTFRCLTPPAAPTLTVDSIGQTTVNLSWSSPDTTETYDVYRNGSKVVSDTSSTSWQDTSRSPNTEYTYTVVAKNAAGDSPQSSSKTALTLPATPSLTKDEGTEEYVKISWTITNGADNFTIYRNGSAIASNVSSGTRSYTDNVTDAGTYEYKVRAHNATGSSPDSNTVSHTIQVPLAPVLSNTALITGNSIEISWTKPSGSGGTRQADVVDIYDANTNTLIASDVSGNSYMHDNLNELTQYCYYLIGKNDAGSSAQSNQECFTTTEYTPHAPENLAGSYASNSITLTWDAPSSGGPVDEYYVDVKRETESDWGSADRIVVSQYTTTEFLEADTFNDGGGDTTFQHGVGEMYDFRVKSVGPGGDSQYTDPIRITWGD